MTTLIGLFFNFIECLAKSIIKGIFWQGIIVVILKQSGVKDCLEKEKKGGQTKSILSLMIILQLRAKFQASFLGLA